MCCLLLVREHGEGGSEGPGGVQEIPDGGAVPGFRGKSLLRSEFRGFFTPENPE